MDFFALLGILIVIGLLVGSVLGWVANSRVNKLEAEVRYIRALLDGKLANSKLPTQAPPKSKAVVPTQAAPPPKTAPPPLAEKKKLQPAALKTKTPPTKKKPAPKPTKKKRSFEEEIGTRWAVWVGGATLALGAIFLLRYAVEAGVFTPAMRVGMAVLLGLISLSAGEFLRRKDAAFFKDKLKVDDLEKSAYIPGILTAVGIFALFGAVYAAYALYNLILPITAFAGLALVSFAALGLSLIQGPKIAGLGIVGALVTPLLVSSDLSNYPMLFSYLAVVTAASVFLSRMKAWGWLTLAAMFGALFWMWTSHFDAEIGKAFWPWAVFAAGLFAAAHWLCKDDNQEKKLFDISFDIQKFISAPALIWFALWAVILISLDDVHGYEPAQHIYASLGAAALMLTGYFRKNLPQLILLGGFVALSISLGSSQTLGIDYVMRPEDLNVISGAEWFISLLGLAGLFMGLTALKTRGEQTPAAAIWAGLGMIVPIVMLLSGNMAGLSDTHVTWLMLGVMAANMAAAAFTQRSDKTAKSPLPYIGPAAFYCAGAAIAYTFAVMYGLTPKYMTGAFMLGIILPLIAYRFLPERIFKVIALGFATFTVLHVLFYQIATGHNIGARPIFNALWIFLALPAILCAGAAWVMERDRADIWAELMKAFALTFAALFAVFQVRHLMNGGDMLANRFGFDEAAMQVLVGLCFTLGGMRLGRAKTGETLGLLSLLAMGISLAALAVFVLAVMFGLNPLLNHDTLINGGPVFNSLALGYLLPSIVLGAIAWLGRETRSKHYVRLCGGLSLISFMLYITAMIRRGFSGNMISVLRDWPGDVELYAISAAWLLLGVLLLALGLKMKRQDVRLASAVVITATVLKAFLVDMASLEGALRALSFVVLGVVLIIIGRVYQRLLFKDRVKTEA